MANSLAWQGAKMGDTIARSTRILLAAKGFYDEAMIHGGSNKTGRAWENRDEGSMVEAWNSPMELDIYLRTSGELCLDAHELIVRPWSLGIRHDGKGMAYPWSLWTTWYMKWWNRTSGPRAVLLVSSKGVPKMVRGEISEYNHFYPEIGGHVLTPEFGSLHETP